MLQRPLTRLEAVFWRSPQSPHQWRNLRAVIEDFPSGIVHL